MQPALYAISVEITNRCNLRCKMCLHHSAAYRGQADTHPPFMDIDFFKDIVDQYVKMPVTSKSIAPQYQGEPLVHPKFLEMCQYVNSKNITIGFSTNAMLLTKEVTHELLKMKNFSNIGISIDGVTKETFEKIRVGSNFDRIMENLEYFLSKVSCVQPRTGKYIPHVIVNYTRQDENEHEFHKFLVKWINNKKISYVTSAYVTDTIGRPTKFNWKPEKRICCTSPFVFMVILTNGQVSPCCRDHLYELNMGNLHDSSLEEIWNGKKYDELRTVQLEGKWDEHFLCGNCDTWMCALAGRKINKKYHIAEDIGPFYNKWEMRRVP